MTRSKIWCVFFIALINCLAAADIETFFGNSKHTNNWAILLGGEEMAYSILSVYNLLKRLGLPDSQIILMIPFDIACNPRKVSPGYVSSSVDDSVNIYDENIEIDYRGTEASGRNLLKILSNRLPSYVPKSKRMSLTTESNVLVFITSHGSAPAMFISEHDLDMLYYKQLQNVFKDMHIQGRYNELLLVVNSCNAGGTYSHVDSPNVLMSGSSSEKEKSRHQFLGPPRVYLDYHTKHMMYALKEVINGENISLYDVVMKSDDNFVLKTKFYKRDVHNVDAKEFFASVSKRVEFVKDRVAIPNSWKKETGKNVEFGPSASENFKTKHSYARLLPF